MSAPAGWHKQADGRERFWDGEQWTDQFRDPATSPSAASGPGPGIPAAAERKASGGVKPWMKYAGVGVVGLILGAMIGAGGGDAEASGDDVAAPAETSTVTVTVEPSVPAETVTIEPTLPAETVTVTAAPPAPQAAITEGVWVVGEDIEPGRYRTINPVASDCYWGIYAAGTNGDDIIANDIVTGGRPTVTLSEGQEFENNGCGDWAKSE